MEYLQPAGELHPRIESSRVVYPTMQCSLETNRFFWTSTAHLTADPLSDDALYFLLDRRAVTGGGLAGNDQFVIEAIYEDWRFLTATPDVDPIQWMLNRSVIHRNKPSAVKCLARLHKAGWLIPQKKGIAFTPEYDVIARHQERRPSQKAYAKLFLADRSLLHENR